MNKQKLFDRFIEIMGNFAQIRAVAALRDGFIMTTPFTICGSIFLLIANLPIPGYGDFMASIFGSDWTAALNAVTIAERLRTKISEIEVHVDNETIIRPTVSIGISEYPNASEDIKELIDWADKALYVSKENGKNCIHLYFDGAFTRYNP